MPKDIVLTEDKGRILGGEAAMWTELATPETIDSRLWYRTAAIAERLWSAENITDSNSMRKRIKMVSLRLEELGLTHLKNKEVILRNSANNQNTDALNEFSNVCEPLKKYSRNKGGTEYQMYSPFTLFADACAPDAVNALDFDTVVNQYLENKNVKNRAKVTDYLNKWIALNKSLIALGTNAHLVQPILPLAKSLSAISEQLALVLNNGQSVKPEVLIALLEECNSKNHADVELAVYDSLKKLL